MASLQTSVVLTPEERLARRRLILRDTVSLLTLFLITAVIFALTWLLFRSFQTHRQDLGQRWERRGEEALRRNQPKAAIEALRSALAYVPSRNTEIELATALAAAGRTQEAIAYFNTLRESAPGDGNINLQLARLAVRQGNQAVAVRSYQDALDGTWLGNGFNLRREVRLELARYLIASQNYTSARSQLLVAASNAPDDPGIRIEIAGLLEKAKAPQDALGIYRAVAARRAPPFGALEGAGRTAFALGFYRQAREYLSHAMSATTSLPIAEADADQNMLNISQRLLLLYPAFDLPALKRAQRVLAARSIANKRLTGCVTASAAAPARLAPLVTRWDQLPKRLTASGLDQQPDLEQNILQLVYDTEKTTAEVCGPPTGDDALLLRIARNPAAVEQE